MFPCKLLSKRGGRQHGNVPSTTHLAIQPPQAEESFPMGGGEEEQLSPPALAIQLQDGPLQGARIEPGGRGLARAHVHPLGNPRGPDGPIAHCTRE